MMVSFLLSATASTFWTWSWMRISLRRMWLGSSLWLWEAARYLLCSLDCFLICLLSCDYLIFYSSSLFFLLASRLPFEIAVSESNLIFGFLFSATEYKCFVSYSRLYSREFSFSRVWSVSILSLICKSDTGGSYPEILLKRVPPLYFYFGYRWDDSRFGSS